MSEVVLGTMPRMGEIETETGKVSFKEMTERAMWDFLRINVGKTEADNRLRELREDYLRMKYGVNLKTASRAQKTNAKVSALSLMLPEVLQGNQREIQWIFKGEDVYAVATKRHLLVPPQEVIAMAHKYMPDLHQGRHLHQVAELEEMPGLRMMFQFDPGNIFTRRAISVGYAISVITCTNPLSFLGGGHLNRFEAGKFPTLQRTLRAEHKTDLEERIRNAIENRNAGLDKLKDGIQDAKDTALPLYDAKTLMTGFPLAYGAGKKVIDDIVGRYLSKEEQTLWGAAMATSYVAQHAESSRNKGELNKGLATAGAAILMLDDYLKTADLVRKWMVNVKKLELGEWL